MSIWGYLGVISGVGAGLFNLFATLLTVGEPAPTGLLKMAQIVENGAIFEIEQIL